MLQLKTISKHYNVKHYKLRLCIKYYKLNDKTNFATGWLRSSAKRTSTPPCPPLLHAHKHVHTHLHTQERGGVKTNIEEKKK